MNARIKDKIKDIEEYLFQLEKIKPETFEKYEEDIKAKAACERFVEKIVEATNDLAILIIKEKRLTIPEEESRAFDILADSKIISEDIAEKLRKAKGMRNVLAHQYRDVNDEIIFNAVSNQLQKDVKDFLDVMKNVMK
jgi:uncharacterized protein YutE (UPF0331/DUF86 family)